MKKAVTGLVACLLAGLLFVLIAAAAHAELKPINPFAATEAAPTPPSAFAPPAAAPFQASGPTGLFSWVLEMQQSLQRSLAMSVKRLKTDSPIGAALTLVGLSFL